MKHLLCLGALALAACGKPADPPKPAPAAATPVPEPPAPRLYVSVNDSDEAEVPAGWPLVLRVSLQAPGAQPIRLVASTGSWSSLVRLDRPEGPWVLRASEVTGSELTIDAATSGMLLWTMTPEELDAVPRGAYRFEARLEAPPGVAGAWSGAVRAYPADVTLVKAIPRLNEAQELEWSRQMASLYLARGDGAAADRVAADLLRKWPKQIGALLLRVDLLEASGKRAEAIELLDRAIEMATAVPNGKVAPLVRRRERLALPGK